MTYLVNDIDQRNLGDCYFLESLAEVANVTNRIQGVFLTQAYNTAGIFAV